MTTRRAPVSVTVARVTDLTPRLRRLTLTAPEFAAHQVSGPDEYFGLLMPRLGEPFVPFPVAGMANLRGAVAEQPERTRPQLRWYTVRAHQPAEAEIDVDIVLHGDAGPGTAWVRRVSPGQGAGLWLCDALWQPAFPQVMIADPTSAPALWHTLSRCTAEQLAGLSVAVVRADASEIEPAEARACAGKVGRFAVLDAAGEEGEHLIPPVLEWLTGLSRLGSRPAALWVSGEGELAKAVRREAIENLGVAKDAIVWVPYWFTGRARP